MEMGVITPIRVILGTIMIVIILEAVRRMTGPVLTVLGLLFILYAAFNAHIPGAQGGKVIPLDYLINYLFLDTNSLLGSPMGVTATVVLPFILFGSSCRRWAAAISWSTSRQRCSEGFVGGRPRCRCSPPPCSAASREAPWPTWWSTGWSPSR